MVDKGQKPGGIGVLDLTPAYRDFCNSMTRAFKLDKSGEKVTIQDEVRFRRRAFYDSWWLATLYKDTQLEISSDGRNALLIRNGKKMKVSLFSDMKDLKFIELPCSPLPNSEAILAAPKNWENYKRLAVHLINGNRVSRDGYTLKIIFENADKASPSDENIIPIKDWKL